MAGASPARTLVEEATFDVQRKLLVPDAELWDAICAGLYFTIARNPLLGNPVPGKHIRVLATRPAPAFDLPSFRLIYDWDDVNIYLLWIEER